jgi:hypothetical protein
MGWREMRRERRNLSEGHVHKVGERYQPQAIFLEEHREGAVRIQ